MEIPKYQSTIIDKPKPITTEWDKAFLSVARVPFSSLCCDAQHMQLLKTNVFELFLGEKLELEIIQFWGDSSNYPLAMANIAMGKP